MRRDPLRVLSILARHGVDRYPDALSDLRAFHRDHLPSARCDVLVVDNSGAAFTAGPGEPEIVAASDRYREFSSWDAGIAHVGSRIWDYDFVHLVTSAFRTLYTRYIDRCDERTLGLIAGRGVAVGHVDYYNQPVEQFGNRSQCWLRSSFVFLPPAEVAMLRSVVGVSDPTAFFSGDPSSPFREAAPLSPNYRQYLVDWLTGAGTGQGVTWHSRFALTGEMLPLFEAKALAILNEHMLTIRLRRQGCAVVDATWLATQADRRRKNSDPLLFPHWRDQLANRDTDAVRVPPAG